ncbi:hypothetical protein GR183_17005 [Stappia sp. GBMRC 2046]|uniref:Alpha-L-glutamate ligase-related protein ATP-grasp domain-containing protein n=1 Tax=Stappia sediminis TaxID=2692190 RepID=A0A7X3LX16_9HYPH|nr:sugar-transfer associated ATP-grasp domain-containing protein [Stappia sediminis]MXN66618.1 hypothetical protein [Stappia sediminis]
MSEPISNPRPPTKNRSSLLRPLRRVYRILSEEFPVYFRTGDRKPLMTQVADILHLWRLYRYIPYQYVKHGLFRRSFGAEIARYLPPELLHRTREAANAGGDRTLIQDKLAFEERLALAGTPSARTLYRLKDRLIFDREGCPVTFGEFASGIEDLHLPRGIIVKPRGGGSGSAIFRMRVEDGKLLHEGAALSDKEFFHLVFMTNNGFYWDEFLVQETIVQHADMERFNPTSVNTVRIDTLIGDNGRVEFNAAAIKIGAPGAITDNVSNGGVTAGIDLATGRLDRSARTDAKFGGGYFDLCERYSMSPDTLQIPFWDEVLRIVTKAAEVMLPFRSLGWDIAISKDGPVIIETNYDYGVDILQEHAGGYLDRPLGRAYIEKFAENKQALADVLGKVERKGTAFERVAAD